MNVSANLLEFLKKSSTAELLGIGTFRVNYTPASISPITNTLTPPKRVISFSNELNDDMSFVEEVAKWEFISVETAKKWIGQYADSLKERIEQTGSCKIGEIGNITKTPSGAYQFNPIEGLNLLDSSFAFYTLKQTKTFEQGDYIKPIITKEPKQEEEIKQEAIRLEQAPLETVYVGIEKKEDAFLNKEEKDYVRQEDISNKESEDRKEEVEKIREDILKLEQERTKDIEFEEREVKDIRSESQEIIKEVEERIKEKEEEKKAALNTDEFNYKNKEQYKKKRKFLSKLKKKERKHNRKKNKLIWLIILFIMLGFVFLCGGLVFAHYMCWLKDIKEIESITLRLEHYIKPKCEKEETTILIPVVAPKEVVIETPTETITEIIQEDLAKIEEAKLVINSEPKKTKPIENKKPAIAKDKELKPTGEKDNPPKPTAEIDYSKPVLMQQVSRLGFDVIGGVFENINNAEQSARKARSLGYDSYIISKKADERTRYYVSYGSRRTMAEANRFLTQITQKHGSGNYYIISR